MFVYLYIPALQAYTDTGRKLQIAFELWAHNVDLALFRAIHALYLPAVLVQLIISIIITASMFFLARLSMLIATSRFSWVMRLLRNGVAARLACLALTVFSLASLSSSVVSMCLLSALMLVACGHSFINASISVSILNELDLALVVLKLIVVRVFFRAGTANALHCSRAVVTLRGLNAKMLNDAQLFSIAVSHALLTNGAQLVTSPDSLLATIVTVKIAALHAAAVASFSDALDAVLE